MLVKTYLLPFDIKISRYHKNDSYSSPDRIKSRNYNKIFCIGYGKTGTTSLQKTLKSFGFSLGDQAVAEMLSEDWGVHKRADRIIRYCHTADAFQDAPFMFKDLYKELDQEFPNSKFILSVRDNENQWFNSLKKFHTSKFSSDKNSLPTEGDLRNAAYRYKGFALDSAKFMWDYPNIPLYDDVTYKKKYLTHIEEVNKYFSSKGNFIQLNVAIRNDFYRLCEFLEIETKLRDFPWANKTSKIIT